MRLAAAALALAAGACGAPDSGSDGTPSVDSVFVDVLASVHLADARAALAPDSARREVLAESLRTVALRRHGLTPEAFEARLAALADDPAAAVALYDALDARLSLERPVPVPTAPTF